MMSAANSHDEFRDKLVSRSVSGRLTVGFKADPMLFAEGN